MRSKVLLCALHSWSMANHNMGLRHTISCLRPSCVADAGPLSCCASSKRISTLATIRGGEAEPGTEHVMTKTTATYLGCCSTNCCCSLT